MCIRDRSKPTYRKEVFDMYCIRKVADDLLWIGGNDRQSPLFESAHPVPRGMSYNAYLLPVSYTHLDVYKRQRGYSRPPREKRAPPMRLATRPTRAPRYLDVYKRQGWRSTKRIIRQTGYFPLY